MLFLTTAHSGPEGLSRHIAGGRESILRECYHMFISFLSSPLEADTALGHCLKGSTSQRGLMVQFSSVLLIKRQNRDHPDLTNQVIPGKSHQWDGTTSAPLHLLPNKIQRYHLASKDRRRTVKSHLLLFYKAVKLIDYRQAVLCSSSSFTAKKGKQKHESV